MDSPRSHGSSDPVVAMEPREPETVAPASGALPEAPLPPRVLVGLGNPGDRYAGTRHNAGFLVIDEIRRRTSAAGDQDVTSDGEWFTVRHGDRELILAKPLTFMNVSGQAVRRLRDRFGVAPAEILVICDCLDLPLGRLRLRPGGSSGGHHGLDSVIAELGTDQFPRLRIGIGRDDATDVIDFVLSPWLAAEREQVERTIAAAAAAALLATAAGLVPAMNRYNGWKAAAETPASEQQEGDRTK